MPSASATSGGRPAAWLRDNLEVLRAGSRVLDVACGEGRHALFLAARGFAVHAIDRDRDALALIEDRARALRAAAGADGMGAVTTQRLDLECHASSLGARAYGAIVVFNYLHRPLFPALVEALVPGGVLIYETFTSAQAARGRPTNPAFLLQPGELPRLVAPLRVVRSREGDVEGRSIASVVAVRA